MRLIKTTLTIVAMLCCSLAFTSCKSNEEKAAELIDKQLSKTLYDYESYKPIETVVTEAYETPYNDSICLEYAARIVVKATKLMECMEEFKDNFQTAQIWGPPSYYSSSYSDSRYYQAKNKAKQSIEEANQNVVEINELIDNFKSRLKKLDKTKVIGWEVKHDFRCKTKGGLPEIGHYVYIMDDKMSKIISSTDTEDEDYVKIKDIIDNGVNGSLTKFDKLDIDF